MVVLLHPLATARLGDLHRAHPSEIRSLDDYIAAQSFGLALMRLSPGTLFTEAVLGLLNPETRTLGPMLPMQMRGAILGAPLPLDQSLLLIWPQITGLIAGMIVVFAAAYVIFQREGAPEGLAHRCAQQRALVNAVARARTVGVLSIPGSMPSRCRAIWRRAKRTRLEQRQAVRILLKSNLPGAGRSRTASRPSTSPGLGSRCCRGELITSRRKGDDNGFRPVERTAGWRLPAALFSDDNFAMFSGRRDGAVVAGGTFYRADGVVGLSNIVAEADDAPAVWRDLAALAATTFPNLPLVGYETEDELKAAAKAGFEAGDPLRIWVRSRE
jgi:hypothetical protein